MAHYPRIFDFTSTPIDICEIAWGTGGGITSSNYFVFDCSRINLVMGGTSSLNSATDSVYLSSIIGGSNNIIKNATGSSIQSSCLSCIYGNNFSGGGYHSIIGGYCNCILSATGSVILGGKKNEIESNPINVYVSGSVRGLNSIIGGASNSVLLSGCSGILGGYFNNICQSLFSIIGGGSKNTIYSSIYSSISSGNSNELNDSSYSGIISGVSNYMYQSPQSVISGGKENCIICSHLSFISGCKNVIECSLGSSTIIAGCQNQIYCSKYVGIISSKYGCIEKSIGSTILSGYNGCAYYIYLDGNKIVNSCNSILSGGRSIFESPYCRDKTNKIYSSVALNVIGGACNLGTSSFGSSILAGYRNTILGSTQSSIIGGRTQSIINSTNSTLLGGYNLSMCQSYGSLIGSSYQTLIESSTYSTILSSSASAICSSNRSSIIGGYGLTISNESDVVYVSTLKIDSVTQSVDSTKVLVWDNDKCVRYTTSVGGNSPIDICEIAWGTGTGITSSNYFLFDCSCINLVMGGNTPSNRVNTATNSVFLSSIIGGLDNCLLGLTASSIIGGSCNTIWSSCYSSILAGKALTITQSNFSTIINGSSSQVKSVFSTIVSGICQCIDTNSEYSSIVGGKCGCITSSDHSSIVGGFAGNSKNTIRNSNSSLVLNSTCYSLIGTSSCSMISNAFCSKIENSKNSLILGGNCDCIINQSYRSLIFGYRNIIENSKDSIIFGHRNNCICNQSYFSTIISGCLNVITNNACDSIIIHGLDNCIVNSGCRNWIIGSDNSKIDGSSFSGIASSTSSNICQSQFSIIEGSLKGCIRENYHSSIVAAECSCIIGNLGVKPYNFDIILGGCCNTIGTSSLSSIIGGFRNTINRGNTNTSIISSCCSFAQFNVNKSTIIGSEDSCLVLDVYNSAILGGEGLVLKQSKNSVVGFSTASTICCSNSSINLGGYRNIICNDSTSSGILLTDCSNIYLSKNSSIISSFKSCICSNSLRSSIISSCCSKIISSTNSAIIGGTNSSICVSQNSAIIGGVGLTLSNENQVVYLPELKINNVNQCLTLTKFLAWDDTNKYVRWGTPGLEQGITGSTIFYTGTAWTYSSTNIYNNGTYVGIGITNSNTNTYATPSSNLHVFGSLSLDVKTASSNYTLTDRNFTLLAYSTSSGMTVSLPLAAVAKQRVYVIKRVTTTGEVRISPQAGDNIEGYGSYITLDTQWDYNILQSDGVNTWIKLGGAVGLNL